MPSVTSSNTTLEYFDGFDDWTQSQGTRYWTGEAASNVNAGSAIGSPGALSGFSPQGGAGRNGTSSLRLSGAVFGDKILVLTLTAQATRTLGAAFRFTVFTASSTQPTCLFSLLDSSIAQLGLRLNNDGTLSVVRGPGQNGGGTVLATSTNALSLGVWYYIEFSSVINSSTGSYAVKVNGASAGWPGGTGANTRQTANNSANAIGLMGFGGAQTSTGTFVDIDDFYSRTDGTFCGDIRVESLLPSGNAGTIQWTPLAGSNYAEVADNPADDDTSYNSAASSGLIDLYSYPNLPTASGTIYGVMTAPILRNDSAGSVTAQSVYLPPAAANSFGGTQTIGSTTYTAYPDIQGQNPNTSSAWTISDINGTKFGIKRTS